jgi:hypothetical protein
MKFFFRRPDFRFKLEALSLGRTWLDALEKVVTVLGKATEEEELVTKTKKDKRDIRNCFVRRH